MDIINQSKIPRKRVANFTADEKAVLAQLVKNKPIIEAKLTDGKSVAKKQVAWELLTREFNSNANVHKRETLTLKRAWDNMKAHTRKARATERGDFFRTGGGPPAPRPPPQDGAIMNMVLEAAPSIICEINNEFDSDGAILQDNKSSMDTYYNILETDEMDAIIEGNNNIEGSNDTLKKNTPQLQNTPSSPVFTGIKKAVELSSEQVRKPSDFVRREAVLRIKHWGIRKKIEMQILKTQLEVQQIKKQGALLKEERNGIKLEKAKIEELKKLVEKQNAQN